MNYFLYILYSKLIDKYYIGQTQDISSRLYKHNNSGSKSTKKANDWKVVYTESFPDRSSACRREIELKKRKSRLYIESLISDSE